jgi:hypothetical protein
MHKWRQRVEREPIADDMKRQLVDAGLRLIREQSAAYSADESGLDKLLADARAAAMSNPATQPERRESIGAAAPAAETTRSRGRRKP